MVWGGSRSVMLLVYSSIPREIPGTQKWYTGMAFILPVERYFSMG